MHGGARRVCRGAGGLDGDDARPDNGRADGRRRRRVLGDGLGQRDRGAGQRGLHGGARHGDHRHARRREPVHHRRGLDRTPTADGHVHAHGRGRLVGPRAQRKRSVACRGRRRRHACVDWRQGSSRHLRAGRGVLHAGRLECDGEGDGRIQGEDGQRRQILFCRRPRFVWQARQRHGDHQRRAPGGERWFAGGRYRRGIGGRIRRCHLRRRNRERRHRGRLDERLGMRHRRRDTVLEVGRQPEELHADGRRSESVRSKLRWRRRRFGRRRERLNGQLWRLREGTHSHYRRTPLRHVDERRSNG